MARLGALLLLTGLCATAQTGGPQETVRQGWQALGAKEWEGAELLFRTALRDAPDSPEAHVGLGLAYARQGRYDRALPELERGRELASRYEGLDLELGRALYMNKRYGDAIPPLENYRAAHPDVWQTYEILGLCYFQTKAFEKSLDAFSHPGLAGRTEHAAMYDFYKAAAHFLLGHDEGRPALDGIVQRHAGTPYADSASKLLASAPAKPVAQAPATDHDLWARARRLRPDRWWYVFAGAAGGYDTNPVSIGHDAVVEGSLANQPAAIASLNGGFGARIINNERTLWGVEARHSALWHNELSKFDQQQPTASMYIEHWPLEWLGLGGTVSASRLWVGGEETRDTWTFGRSVYLVEVWWTRTRVYFDFQNNEYFLDVSEVQDFDAWTNTLGVVQEAYIPGTELRAAIGYAHTWQQADGDDYDADFDRVSVQVVHPIVWGIRGTASFSYTRGDYKEDNSRDPGTDARDDDTYVYGFRLDRPINDWLSAYMSGTWINGESSIGVFDYDRNLYSAGVEIRY